VYRLRRSLHLCLGAPTTSQSYAGFRHDRSDPLRTWSSRSQQRLKLQRNRGHGRRHAYGIVGPSRPTPPSRTPILLPCWLPSYHYQPHWCPVYKRHIAMASNIQPSCSIDCKGPCCQSPRSIIRQSIFVQSFHSSFHPRR
jgi:hypothetical protein